MLSTSNAALSQTLDALSAPSTYDEDLQIYNHIKQVVQLRLMEREEEYTAIAQAMEKGKKRIPLSLTFLNSIAPDFAKRVMNDPFTYLPPCERAIIEVARQQAQLENKDDKNLEIKLGLCGWLGAHSVTPRGISSELANRMILVEGIVTRATPAKPLMKSGVYYIPELSRHIYREYASLYNIMPKHESNNGHFSTSKLQKDNEGHTLELEYGLSKYNDIQFLTIQEVPEVTPVGQLPRSVEVVVENDLVDVVKPGDRCRVFGVLKSVTYKESAVINGASRLFVIANNVERFAFESHLIQNVTVSTIKQFRDLAARPDTLELVAASIAPSICGYHKVRQGLALQLVGGNRQELQGGTHHQRGDIHILLIGDPSCGKSQLLRYVLKLSPLAISTTGRGSSAVGLTAAVVSDQGSRALEAGAMVLADGGMVCIDEFDKMGNDDRVAVHEVMEQQRVTVMKANISATLNARTSILAAANPIYGTFDDKVDFSQQINFPDSLLSRFDLIFLIRESGSADDDRRISQQVLSQLRCGRDDDQFNNTQRLRAMRADVIAPTLLQPRTEPSKNQALMWTSHPSSQSLADATKGKGKFLAEAVKSSKATRLLKFDFLKQYLAYCKFSIRPEISDEAVEEISSFYAHIRSKIQKEWDKVEEGRKTRAKSIPTPRLLEALLRLATAHAKLKMKTTVDAEDVAEAKRLVLYSMCGVESEETSSFEEPAGAEATRRGNQGAGRGQTHHQSTPPRPSMSTRKRRKDVNSEKLQALSEDVARIELTEGRKRPKQTARPGQPPADPAALDDAALDDAALDKAWSLLEDLRQSQMEEDWDTHYIVSKLMKKHKLSNTLSLAALKRLEKQNRVMFIGNRVYII